MSFINSELTWSKYKVLYDLGFHNRRPGNISTGINYTCNPKDYPPGNTQFNESPDFLQFCIERIYENVLR